MLWREQVTRGEVQVVGSGKEGSGSRAVGHDNVLSSARTGDSSAVVGGAKVVVGRGIGDWMVMEEVRA